MPRSADGIEGGLVAVVVGSREARLLWGRQPRRRPVPMGAPLPIRPTLDSIDSTMPLANGPVLDALIGLDRWDRLSSFMPWLSVPASTSATRSIAALHR